MFSSSLIAVSRSSFTVESAFLAAHPYLLFGVLAGACLASFGCVVVERAGIEGINGRSHCVCGRQLKAWENVPVFGWLRVGGVARCCGAKIPSWYVLAEVAGAVLGGIGAWFGLGGFAAAMAIGALVVAVARTRRR